MLGALIIRWLAPIVIERVALCVCTGDALSLTPTVNVDVPAAVGVPEIAPAAESVNPAGRLPDCNVHV